METKHQDLKPVTETPSERDELLTIEEVAALLKLPVRSIHQARTEGIVQIDEVRIGNRTIRYRKSDVDRVIRGEVMFTKRAPHKKGGDNA